MAACSWTAGSSIRSPSTSSTAHADITIAIDVSGAPVAPGKRPHPSAFAALMASSQIMQRTIVREKLKVRQPDIYIDVEVDEYYVLDFHRFKQILAAAAPAQAAAAPSARARSRQPDGGDAAGYRSPGTGQLAAASPTRKRRLPSFKRLSPARKT